jgi:D-alanyl-D-alanine carboxypeptidase
MRISPGVVVPAVLLLGPLCGSSAVADALDDYVGTEMRTHMIPGLAFAVVQDGRVSIQRVYGKANLETGTPVQADTVFEIASVTKPFTATAILMLVNEGRLKLDDSIVPLIPGATAAWAGITVRHLLSHTSGIGGGGWVECQGSPLLEISTERHFSEIVKAPLQCGAGERMAYSDGGYFLLGMIIEHQSGLSYRDVMERRIFAPLGMTQTTIIDRRQILKNHASPYTVRAGQVENGRRVWQHELPAYFGMVSTVEDLAKWDIALGKGRVLKQETLDLMWTPRRLAGGAIGTIDGFPYGLGWFTGVVNGRRVVGHLGYLGSAMFRFVDDGVGVIVLTNLDVASGSHEVTIAQGILTAVRPELPRFMP